MVDIPSDHRVRKIAYYKTDEEVTKEEIIEIARHLADLTQTVKRLNDELISVRAQVYGK